MKHRKVMFVILVSIFAITVNQSYLWSGEPGTLVKKVILSESSFNKIDDINERKTKQWDAISSSFNFEKISQRVMGEYWNKCLYEQKSGFVELFTSHLKCSYVKKANPLFGERIISLKEKQFSKFANVQTNTGTNVSMSKSPGLWNCLPTISNVLTSRRQTLSLERRLFH